MPSNVHRPDAWGLKVQAENIPQKMKDVRRWVCWRARRKVNGKGYDKIPVQAKHPDRGASVDNRAHWSDYDTAVETYQNDPSLSGIGFVMTDIKGLVGIDIDNCFDIETGEMSDTAHHILQNVDSYAEVSPSGTGLRIFALGELPDTPFTNNEHGVEMYNGTSPRYLTVTGSTLRDDMPLEHIEPERIEAVYTEYRTGTGTEVVDRPLPDITDINADAYPVPDHLDAFLLEGDIGDSPSRSERLMATVIGLYREDYTDEVVLAVLVASPHAWQTALDHRQQNHDKAMAYLWQQCLRARAYLGMDGQDFEVLEDLVAPEPEDVQDTAPSYPQNGKLFRPTQWEGTEVPVKQWLIKDWVPMGAVTLLYGDGGVGKSLLAMQLQTCVATGTRFFDQETTRGEVLGVYCEDGVDDLHIRQSAINDSLMLDWSDLSDSLMLSRLGKDNMLITFDGKVQGKLTALHEKLTTLIEQRPDLKLVIIDTAADTFGGNENVRGEVRQYIQRALGQWAVDRDMAVVVCAHPSVSGKAEGTSGSTGWSNSARSRLHITRDENLPDMRLLTRKKSNYSGIGDCIRMYWKDGALVPEQQASELINEPQAHQRDTFLRLLREHELEEQRVGVAIQGNYAPRIFARVAGARGWDGITRNSMEVAMQQLLDRGVLAVEQDGRNRTSHLVIREEML